MEYKELLARAYERLPSESEDSERFEIPMVESMIMGNQTIIKNFVSIAQTLLRDPKHLLKFMTKELAAPGSIEGQRATFQTKMMKSQIQKKLELYVRDYVICKECNRPDTKIVKDDRLSFVKCEACGAKYPVKSV